MRYRGKLYRALNPLFAREPLSGRGAERYGGRFNPRGMPALYTSLSIMAALREANQTGNLQPTMLVCYEAEYDNVFDTRDRDALRELAIEPSALADPSWRDQMKAEGNSATQRLAQTLVDRGYHGLLVRSFAPGATADDLNLVLWQWGSEPPCHLTVIDDEERLDP